MGREIPLRVAQQDESPEIFYTLQGEGRNVGQPTVFYRTSECNLQCVWCDTPYTWNWDGTPYVHDDDIKYSREEQQTKLTVGESVDLITRYRVPHVVITGGEPMLQQANLLELAYGLLTEDRNYKIDIETNGTVMPNERLARKVNLFTVSPKLENSGNRLDKRYRPEVIDAFVALPNADFKFVVTSIEDIPEILTMINNHQIPAERVFLMPEGRTRAELAAHTDLVAELAKKYKFNFTSRLHIELWGDKRGV